MVRRNRKRVSRLLIDGDWIYDQGTWKLHVRDFENSLFGFRPVVQSYDDFRQEEELASLVAGVSMEEVRNAFPWRVWRLLDLMQPLFYQRHWEVVSQTIWYSECLAVRKSGCGCIESSHGAYSEGWQPLLNSGRLPFWILRSWVFRRSWWIGC